MSLAVTVDPEWIEIRLSGLSAISAGRRTIRVPWLAVDSVRTEPFAVRGRGVAPQPLRGTLVRSLTIDRRRFLLCYRDGEPTLTLELDRTRAPRLPFDVIVLGVGPETTVVLPIRGARAA